jgi:glycosyltransferase involved in cell wall biosynthesis
MRIIIFYQYFGTPKGKWSTRIYELSKRWINNGYKVTVVTSPYEKSDITANNRIERQNIDGIDLIIINYPDSNRLPVIKRVKNFIMFSVISVWFALSEPYDIIISSSGPITVGVPALIAKWFRRKKFIFEIRDLWPQGAVELGLLKNKMLIKIAYFFEKLCYVNSEYVIAASQGMKDDLINRFPDLKVEVISNAADIELFDKKPDKNLLPFWVGEKKIILHFGSMGLIHNCMQLINGVIELKRRGREDFWVIFIGEGAERKELEEKARRYKLKNVKFLGLMPKRNLVKWVVSSEATVLTTLDNPVQNTCSPNKIFDSFAAGVPVIQTTTGWIKELIEREKCGINVTPNDAYSMAEGILQILDDTDLRNELAYNAKRVANEYFDRKKLAENYQNIIELVT